MRWTIGNVTVTKIVASELGAELAQLIPRATPKAIRSIDWLAPEFATPEGVLLYSFHALVIETPSTCILVDTCVGNDKPRAIAPFLDRMQGFFLARLLEAGYAPETINQVVCTHLHVDHVGWNTRLVDGRWLPTVPNARYLFARDEFDFWRRELTRDRASPDAMAQLQRDVMEDSVQPVLSAGLADFVPADHSICPEVRLQPSLGHTGGHVCVVIRSQGQSALITGDAIHHPCQLAHPEWGTIADHNLDQAAATRIGLMAEAEACGTLVIGTHWAGDTAGFLQRAGSHYKLK